MVMYSIESAWFWVYQPSSLRHSRPGAYRPSRPPVSKLVLSHLSGCSLPCSLALSLFTGCQSQREYLLHQHALAPAWPQHHSSGSGCSPSFPWLLSPRALLPCDWRPFLSILPCSFSFQRLARYALAYWFSQGLLAFFLTKAHLIKEHHIDLIKGSNSQNRFCSIPSRMGLNLDSVQNGVGGGEVESSQGRRLLLALPFKATRGQTGWGCLFVHHASLSSLGSWISTSSRCCWNQESKTNSQIKWRSTVP